MFDSNTNYFIILNVSYMYFSQHDGKGVCCFVLYDVGLTLCRHVTKLQRLECVIEDASPNIDVCCCI